MGARPQSQSDGMTASSASEDEPVFLYWTGFVGEVAECTYTQQHRIENVRWGAFTEPRLHNNLDRALCRRVLFKSTKSSNTKVVNPDILKPSKRCIEQDLEAKEQLNSKCFVRATRNNGFGRVLAHDPLKTGAFDLSPDAPPVKFLFRSPLP